MRCKAVKSVFLFFAFLVLTASAGVSAAKTIYVPDDYAKIQWAVDSASAGDTIIVRDGVHFENIDVNKQLTIRSENGSKNCIVQSAKYDAVFHVTADYVNIYGFTIKDGMYGIYLDNAFNNTLHGNIIVNNTYGVTVENSWGNVFYKNVLENEYNVYLYDSDINASINIWNSEYPVGGNYWSNYVGFDNYTGPYQNETGSDGIGDEPFLLYKDNYDYYPLMSWPVKEQQPMIDFTFIPEGPKVGDIVHFIDLSP